MSCPWQNSNATIKNYSLQIQITKQIALPNPDLSRSLSINSPSANLSKSLILRERREFYAKLDATLILLVNPASTHNSYYPTNRVQLRANTATQRREPIKCNPHSVLFKHIGGFTLLFGVKRVPQLFSQSIVLVLGRFGFLLF